MKKLIILVVIFMTTGSAMLAQTARQGNGRGINKASRGYVDADNNNICDRAENNTAVQYRNKQGKGSGQMRVNRNSGGPAGGCMRQGRKGRA